MKLMIYSPGPEEKLPEIQWNFEEIRQFAAEKAREYQSIAYTDADVPDMKKDRAEVNKFITALENVRKEKKKEYLAPYDVFEAQIREVLKPLNKTVALICEKLDEVEKQYREGRKQKMEEFYRKYAGNLQPLLPFSKTVKEEYYKRAFTDKKLEQAYADFFIRIREDMQALEELPEKFREKALLKYMESFSLSEAMREGKRLEELEHALEEHRRKQEEEAAVRKQGLAAKEFGKPAEDSGERQESGRNVEEAVPKAETPEVKEEAQKIFQLDFRVWGTREQLMSLRQYLVNSNIKFGKVE